VLMSPASLGRGKAEHEEHRQNDLAAARQERHCRRSRKIVMPLDCSSAVSGFCDAGRRRKCRYTVRTGPHRGSSRPAMGSRQPLHLDQSIRRINKQYHCFSEDTIK
jgi:hypothetical protein